MAQAIHGFRETEKSQTAWNDTNKNVISRLSRQIFSSQADGNPLLNVHVLDLADNGFVLICFNFVQWSISVVFMCRYIKPHIDSHKVVLLCFSLVHI